MSVSKFFAPYCIKPIYFMETSDESGRCGFINGLIYSFIFTITIVIAGFKFYKSEFDLVRKKYILYGMGISICLLWVFLPLLLYYTRKIMWDGYNEAKQDLQKEGYSRMEILNILQLFEQHSAPLNVGGLTGGGMLFAKGTGQQPVNQPEKMKK